MGEPTFLIYTLMIVLSRQSLFPPARRVPVCPGDRNCPFRFRCSEQKKKYEETISQRLMNPCRGCMQLGLDLLGLHSVYHVAAPWIIWVSKRGNDGIYFFNHPGSPKCPGNHLLKGSKYAMVHHGPGSSWCQRAKLLSFWSMHWFNCAFPVKHPAVIKRGNRRSMMNNQNTSY